MKKTSSAVLAGLLFSAAVQAAEPSLNLAADAARELRERARFPEWSQPVAVGDVDPIVSARLPTRQSLAGPGGAAPRLTVWASTISAEAGQSVDLFAKLENLSQDSSNALEILRASQPVAGKISATLSGEQSGALTELAYLDDGQGADAKAGDGIYSARYTLPAARAPQVGTAESVLVLVRAALADGETRTAVGGFQFSNPGARLTGRYRDLVRDGNLLVQAEVEVLKSGRYHLAGTLASLAGLPLASAQSAQVLQPGKQWMTLPYYGLIFHDRGASGALRLASVTLTSVGQMPNALGAVLENAHLTAPLNLAALTRLPFNAPEMLDAALRLEREAAGRKLPLLR